MARRQQALNDLQQIVDVNTGRASEYFKRVIFDRGIGLDEAKTDIETLQDTEVQGGIGIDGGGRLGDGNITLDGNIQELLDVVSSTRGTILYRGAAGWAGLGPGTSGYFLTTSGVGTDPSWAPGGTGTVSTVSVVSANGFAGSVANATTTPAITITTTITGVLKGNGTAISAAVAGTDYLAPAAIGVTVQGYDADLSALAALSGTNTLYYRSAANTWTAVTYDSSITFSGGQLKVTDYSFSFFFISTPTVSEVLALHVAGRAFTIPANFSGGLQSAVGTNPTATFAIDVQRQVGGAGAFSSIGTISVSTGGVVTATTVSGTSKSIAAGDVLKFIAPSPVDSTAANMAFTVIGAR